MIAPCCIVCKKWVSGDFIQFKVVEPKEIEYNEQFFDKDKLTPPGHPFGNFYFCTEHMGLGLKYKHLTWNEAELLIIEAFENNEIPKPPFKFRVLGGVFKIIDKVFSKS
jgi:hypothetical protein